MNRHRSAAVLVFAFASLPSVAALASLDFTPPNRARVAYDEEAYGNTGRIQNTLRVLLSKACSDSAAGQSAVRGYQIQDAQIECAKTGGTFSSKTSDRDCDLRNLEFDFDTTLSTASASSSRSFTSECTPPPAGTHPKAPTAECARVVDENDPNPKPKPIYDFHHHGTFVIQEDIGAFLPRFEKAREPVVEGQTREAVTSCTVTDWKWKPDGSPECNGEWVKTPPVTEFSFATFTVDGEAVERPQTPADIAKWIAANDAACKPPSTGTQPGPGGGGGHAGGGALAPMKVDIDVAPQSASDANGGCRAARSGSEGGRNGWAIASILGLVAFSVVRRVGRRSA